MTSASHYIEMGLVLGSDLMLAIVENELILRSRHWTSIGRLCDVSFHRALAGVDHDDFDFASIFAVSTERVE